MEISNFYHQPYSNILGRILMAGLFAISGWGVQTSNAQCAIDCSNVTDTLYQCFDSIPAPDPNLVILIGCAGNPLVYTHDFSNGGSGCGSDTLTILRLYIVDFDGDTMTTLLDRDTCTQLLHFVDDLAPALTCPPDVTIDCGESTLPANTGMASAADLCDTLPTVLYFDYLTTPPATSPEMRLVYLPPGANNGTCTSGSDCQSGTICFGLEYTPGVSGILTSYTTGFFVNCYNGNTPILSNASCVMADNSGEIDDCGGSGLILMNSSGNTGAVAITQNIPIILHQLCFQLGSGGSILLDEDEATDLTTSVQLPAGGLTSEHPAYSNFTVDFDTYCAQTCPFPSAIYRQFVATDQCGNQSTCVQYILVQDQTPPVLSCPSDLTLECNASTDTAVTGTATATDNCVGIPSLIMTDTILPGNCPMNFTLVRTWTATDDCGNSSTCSQSILVRDSTLPVITCPPNVTIQCNSSTDPADIGMATASDNCDGAPSITFADTVSAGLCPQAFIISRTWTASDACGNMATCTQTITTIDTTPPALTCPADVTIECDESSLAAATGTATATDQCDTAVIIQYYDYLDTPPTSIPEMRWVYLPPGTNSGSCTSASDCQTGTICFALQYTPGVSGILTSYTTGFFINCYNGANPIVSNASCVMADNSGSLDDCAGTGLVLMNSSGNSGAVPITKNVPVILHQVCFQLGSGGSILLDEDEATDLTASIDLPGGGLITETPDFTNYLVDYDTYCGTSCLYPSTIYRAFVATDGCGNQSTCIQQITIQDLTAPTITCPADVTIECNTSTDPAVTGMATATDNCDTLPSIQVVADTIIEGGCPQEMILLRTWQATDVCGNSSTCIQSIFIRDNTAPMITCPADITIQCNTSTDPGVTGAATASDNCDPSVVPTYTDITAAGACPQALTITRTWIAADDCGNSNSCQQIISVTDTIPPALTCPADVTIECDESSLAAATGNATATDQCDTAITIQYFDYLDTPPTSIPEMRWVYLPPGTNSGSCTSASDCQTGTICFALQYTPGVSGILTSYTTGFFINCYNGANPIVSNASCVMADNSGSLDDCAGTGLVLMNSSGNSGAVPITKNVPVILHQVCFQLGSGGSILLDEDEATDLTASIDLPGGGLITETPDFTNYVVDYDTYCATSCPYPFSIFRAFVATDGCGNQSTCIQQITIQDLTAPTITCPVDLTIECNTSSDPMVTGSATATDNCDTSVVISYTDVTTPGACPQSLTISRTWNAVDACGNTSECIQTIFVQDTTPPAITCPVDLTIECSDSSDPIATGSATATDNCDTSVVITYADVTIEGACPQSLTIMRTWNAADGCGNSSTCVQNIFVQDTTPPAITCPVDLTIECSDSSDPIATGSVTATDNCDTSVVITYADVTTAGACPQSLTITRTWNAVDACGNSTECTQTIFVQDTTPPAITCPVDLTIECDASSDPLATGAATATDNCDTSVVITYADVTVEGACPQSLTITRTWNAVDACGNSSECIQTIFIQDTTPPAIICPVDITVDCNTSVATTVTGDATATDNCDATPTIGFDDVTAAGACPQSYIITRTFTAIDDCGNSSSCAQLIFVQDTMAPAITCPVDLTIECSDSSDPIATGTATATDNCDTSVVITYADVTVEGACAQSLTIIRTWNAADGCGNSSTCVQNIFVQDTTPPAITCPVDLTIECSDSSDPIATGSATATDNCDTSVVITYADVTTAGACPQSLTITRTWNAVDACGNSTECTQTIFVQDTTPPAITCPVDLTIECNTSSDPLATGTATATDNCDTSVVITYADVTVEGACPQSLTITRTWNAVDACGNSSECIQTIFIQDTTPPAIICPVDITVDCNTSIATTVTGDATATDNCDATPTIGFDDVTAAGACPQSYIITRTFTAIDDCGNSSSCAQIIFVQDTMAPAITCPVDLTIECSDSSDPIATGSATATDNCDTSVVITYADVTIEGACPQSLTIMRTWNAADGCGNSSTCVQNIFVQDTTPPAITCPVDLTIECSDSSDPIATGSVTATDNCDTSVVITYADVTTAGACPQSLTITRTWNAVDACGNSTECTQTIFVQDTTPPAITCPVDLTIECNTSSDPLATGAATATDNCDTSVVITYADVTVEGACPQSLTITRTWNAVDACGNSSECIQTIFVQDTTPPAIICPVDITVDCNTSIATTVTGDATATDNCDATPTIGFDDVTAAGACPQSYIITRTFTAIDDCGNSSSCAQIIFVQDTMAPAITCPVDLTIECSDSSDPIATGSATATDNCDTSVVITYADVTIEGACPQSLTIMRTWNAADGCGNSSTCVQNIFVQDTTPPAITCPVDLTIECSDSSDPIATGSVTATDNCDTSVVITVCRCNHSRSVSTIPDDTRTWNAVDACGNSTECTQTIFVQDTTPPAITCPVDLTIECDASSDPLATGTATATDNCDTSVVITYADVTVEGACPQSLTITRTWNAVDACGNSSECIQTIFVQDTTPPAIICPVDITVDCNTSIATTVTGDATATDNCDATPTIGFDDVTAAGACPQSYIITRTFTAIDDCGNSSSCAQIIFVQDTMAPAITCPVDLTIECSDSSDPIATGTATATDNCDTSVVITYADVTVEGACAQSMTIMRTWNAADGCGNSSTCVQNIFVQDTTPPAITCPVDLTIECNTSSDPMTTGSVTATDNCDTSVVITYADVTTAGACPQSLTITRTWNAVDACGNSTECTQTIFVQDTTPPAITCPVDLTIECNTSSDPLVTGTATATDNCDTSIVITYADITVAGACPQSLTITRTWNAVDACGNSTECTQTIFVQDTRLRF